VWDELIDLLAQFGVWGEVPGLIRERAHDQLVKIEFDRRGGFSGWEVEKILLRYGVRLCGRGFDHDTLWFHVRKRQANWAEYVLNRYIVPLRTMHNPKNWHAREMGPVPDWGRPLHPRGIDGLILTLLDFFGG